MIYRSLLSSLVIISLLPVASAQREEFQGAPACAWEGTRQATDAFIEALLAPSKTINFLSTFPLFTASPNLLTSKTASRSLSWERKA